MDINRKLENATIGVQAARESLGRALDDVSAAIRKTDEVLEVAKELGVSVVSIGLRSELVKNDDWGFGTSNSLFTHPDDKVDGWPAAWEIARRSGIYSGCGNSGQAQIHSQMVADGVYRLRDGQWHLLEDAS